MNRSLLIALLVGALASSAAAQSKREVAILGCQNATRNEVEAQRRNADSVRFSPHRHVAETSPSEIGVRGSGRYHDRARLEWRPFVYDCTYNTRSAETRVTVCFDSSGDTIALRASDERHARFLSTIPIRMTRKASNRIA